jgi:hypothetical protein
MSFITNLFTNNHYKNLRNTTEKRIEFVLENHDKERDVNNDILNIIFDNFGMIASLDIKIDKLKYTFDKKSVFDYCKNGTDTYQESVCYFKDNLTDNLWVRIVSYEYDIKYICLVTGLIKKYVIY